MDTINKQKFLAEIGRLLTFMYEEDRQTVLAMYGRMFDETAAEPALLELLVSPTRQAVVLARSYDAKARKAQLEAQQDDILSDPDNAPAFIFAIDKVAQQAADEFGVQFLYRDFRPYFRAGQEKAREESFYMQKYCGCVFSEEERYLKKNKIIP